MRRLTRSLVLTFVLGACGAAGTATGQADTSSTAAPSATVPPASPTVTVAPTSAIATASPQSPSVSGRVTAAASGAGLAGVRVQVLQAQVTVFPSGPSSTNCGVPFASATTDASGAYAARVPAGSYCVEFTPAPGSPYAAQRWKAALTNGAVTAIRVDGPITDVDAALQPGYIVRGQITSSVSGGPLMNWPISAQTAPGSNFSAVVGASVVTDASGKYSLVVPAGVYYFRSAQVKGIYYWNGPAPVVSVCPCASLRVLNNSAVDLVLPVAP